MGLAWAARLRHPVCPWRLLRKRPSQYVGDECVLRLLRGGQELELNVK